MKHTQTGSSRTTNLVILIAVIVSLAIAVTLLPKGFSDDLTTIGQGTTTVVLTHDKNSVGGIIAMELLNKIRTDYQGKIDFLAIDVNSPNGQTFTRQQGVGAMVLVVFGPDGNRRRVVSAALNEQGLRSTLNEELSPVAE